MASYSYSYSHSYGIGLLWFWSNECCCCCRFRPESFSGHNRYPNKCLDLRNFHYKPIMLRCRRSVSSSARYSSKWTSIPLPCRSLLALPCTQLEVLFTLPWCVWSCTVGVLPAFCPAPPRAQLKLLAVRTTQACVGSVLPPGEPYAPPREWLP